VTATDPVPLDWQNFELPAETKQAASAPHPVRRDLGEPIRGMMSRCAVRSGFRDVTLRSGTLRRPADHRGRARRWHDAVAQLAELQAQYAVWLEALPDNLQDGATADALRAICELDLAELQAAEPPRGFGRD
jgi:hypothetical protein